MLAVSEIATNAVVHGGGGGILRIWQEDDAVVCDVTSRGRIDSPLVGRERPVSHSVGGYGLWLANEVCDLVQIRSLRHRHCGAAAQALRLSALAPREPADERTEHEPGLRCKGDVGGHADDDAERQTQHGSEADGGSDAHTGECMLRGPHP